MKILMVGLYLSIAANLALSQSTSPPSYATVKVSMPRQFVEDESEPFSDVYELVLKGAKFSKEIPYVRSSTISDRATRAEYRNDEYEVSVPAGLYRIVIKGFPRYKIANFLAPAAAEVTVQIPQFRFALLEVCRDGVREVKLYGSHKTVEEEVKTTRPSIDTRVLQKPFELVVDHCGRYVVGSRTHYKSARMYYQNKYIAADVLVVDSKDLRVTASGTEDFPVEVQIDGGEFKELGSFVLDLKRPIPNPSHKQ
jgi:hypothetical protein